MGAEDNIRGGTPHRASQTNGY